MNVDTDNPPLAAEEAAVSVQPAIVATPPVPIACPAAGTAPTGAACHPFAEGHDAEDVRSYLRTAKTLTDCDARMKCATRTDRLSIFRLTLATFFDPQNRRRKPKLAECEDGCCAGRKFNGAIARAASIALDEEQRSQAFASLEQELWAFCGNGTARRLDPLYALAWCCQTLARSPVDEA